MKRREVAFLTLACLGFGRRCTQSESFHGAACRKGSQDAAKTKSFFPQSNKPRR